jgi:hypothetical protein
VAGGVLDGVGDPLVEGDWSGDPVGVVPDGDGEGVAVGELGDVDGDSVGEGAELWVG